MRVILQILGNLEGYEHVDFYIDDTIEETMKDYFSSQVLAKKSDNSKIIFLAPESLVTGLANDTAEARKLLSNENDLSDAILKKLNGKITVKDYEILVIQSIGMYKDKDKSFQVNFINTADNIVSSVILDLLEKIENFDEIILDISTGHNIYVTFLIDTIRTLIIYFKLRNIMKENSKCPKFKIAYSSPIIKSPNAKYPIRLYDFDERAFFEMRLKSAVKVEALLKDKNATLEQEIHRTFEKANTLFKELFNETKKAYDAIRYNTPLTFFDNELISLNINEKEVLNNLKNILKYIIKDKTEINENNGEIQIRRLNINRTLLIDILLTLALHSALREFKENLEKSVENLENWVPVGIIKNTFKNPYTKIGFDLNIRLLERDLTEIDELAQYLKNGEEKSIKELQENKEKELQKHPTNIKKKEGDIVRNFFVHSGLESTLTLVKKINKEGKDEILLKYKPERKNDIKKWLENPTLTKSLQ
jgi:CRISPR-associated protein Csx1